MSDDTKREGKAKTPKQQMESLIGFIDCYVQALRDDYAHSPPAEGIAALLAVKVGAIEALDRLASTEQTEQCARQFEQGVEDLDCRLQRAAARAESECITEAAAKALAVLTEARLAVLVAARGEPRRGARR